MLCVFLSLFLLFRASVCSRAPHTISVQPQLLITDKSNLPQLHLTLTLITTSSHENVLRAELIRSLVDSSEIVIHSENGSRSIVVPPNQCFYEVKPQNSSDSAGNRWRWTSGVLSVCENGIRGHLKAAWSNVYPNGVIYYLEPEEATSTDPVVNFTWSADSFSKPHRLRVVPISITEQFSSRKPGSTWSRDHFDSGDNEKSNEEMPTTTTTTNDTVQSSTHTMASGLLGHIRQRRAATVTHSGTSELPDLEPIRVLHRPNRTQPYILELYLIVDEVLTSSFRNNYDGLIYRVNMLMALVNSLYAPFNINIVVVQLEIWEHDRSQLNVEEHHLLATLAQFKRMHTTVRHDCLHALLGIKDEASRTRGKANPQTMCVYSRCVGYSRDSPRIELAETARTIAHELGHNFGLRHDTEECKCQRCIMATGVEFGNNILEWSPCSIQDLPVLLNFGMGVCLGDAPIRSIVSVSSVLANESAEITRLNQNEQPSNPIAPAASVVHVYNWMKQLTPLAAVHRTQSKRKSRRHPSDVRAQLTAAGLCGNGQLDPGEECDCGSVTSCPPELRECCDVERCRLRTGSECAGGPCCTVEPLPHTVRSTRTKYRCRLLSAGTTCRNASGTCDLPEYCDGKSQWCPADVHMADGSPCRTDEGQRSYCIRGGCRTADGWCRTLWGDKARRGSADCFYENHLWNMDDKPDPVANCGKHRPSQSERWEDVKSWPGLACQSWQDAECGRLWCDHRNEKAMLLGWIDSRTRVLRSGEVCAALVYDPVWPAADPSTWKSANSTIPGQQNLNSAGVGIFSANTQDAGMVPDGTPCSHGLCYNGTCTSIYDIPSRIECDCRGQGVCNNRGNCHCKTGFRPPNCEYGGDGGSIDSGPPPPVYRFGSPFERPREFSPDSLLPPWAPPTRFRNQKPPVRERPVVSTRVTITTTTVALAGRETTPATRIATLLPPRSTTTPRVPFLRPSFTRRPKPVLPWLRKFPWPSRPRNRSRIYTWPNKPVTTTTQLPLAHTTTKFNVRDRLSSTTAIKTKHDHSPKPELVIPLCLLVFIGLPLVVVLVYWYKNYGCTCPRVIGVSMVSTESGLYKPFDRGVGSCVRRCCRCKIRFQSLKGRSYVSGSYPILAYAANGPKPLENGNWTNGHCVMVVGKVNGTGLDKALNEDASTITNGTVPRSECKPKRKGKKLNKSNKPDLKGLISAPVELGEAQSVKSMEDDSRCTGEQLNVTEYASTLGTNRMAQMWESVLARTNRAHPRPFLQSSTWNDISHNTIKQAAPADRTPQPCENNEPKTTGIVQISQPRLEAMTYQGEMCSLNEAMSTLKRGEKPPKVARNSQTQSAGIRRSVTVKPPERPVPSTTQQQSGRLVIQPTVNRSQSQRFGLSPRDISNPCLQNTTYTEALTDLATMRKQRAQQPHAGAQTSTPDRLKPATRHA